jgi:hypothetical protein
MCCNMFASLYHALTRQGTRVVPTHCADADQRFAKGDAGDVQAVPLTLILGVSWPLLREHNCMSSQPCICCFCRFVAAAAAAAAVPRLRPTLMAMRGP